MDVMKSTDPKRAFFKTKTNLVVMGLVLLSLLLLWSKKSLSTVTVSRSELLIETVQQGDLAVVVEGYGTLISNKQLLISALTRATVKEIILKPGARVHADSIIVRLENPELIQLVNSAQQALAQSKANLRQLKLNHQREKLNESAQLFELTANYESAHLKRQAEEKLLTKGIISTLAFKQTQLHEKQLKQRIDVLSQRTAQLGLVQAEAVNIQQEWIKQQQGHLNIAVARADALTVKAGFDGVLQRLTVELGQSLTAGQQIALIGSVTDLIAMIRIPQNQAQKIILGQQTIIDTRQDKIIGKVARIDPIVENNTVNIEIALPANLPASARPQLNVDGTITTAQLSQVLYIARPANIKPHTKNRLFRFNSQTQSAVKHEIIFGQQAGRYIEIVAGAQLNEQYIISDMSNLKNSLAQLTVEY
jgi:multidrug resistance efflux pump